MSAEFNIPIGRLNSPAPHFKSGLWQRTIVFAASRSGPCLDSDPDAGERLLVGAEVEVLRVDEDPVVVEQDRVEHLR